MPVKKDANGLPSVSLCPPTTSIWTLGHPSMVVCVHCSTPTKELLLSYGPDHVVCTRCPVCGQFADPYVEQEAVIVAIDLVSGTSQPFILHLKY
jgi:hypothetical protein